MIEITSWINIISFTNLYFQKVIRKTQLENVIDEDIDDIYKRKKRQNQY